jgi:replicative DNA helicase
MALLKTYIEGLSTALGEANIEFDVEIEKTVLGTFLIYEESFNQVAEFFNDSQYFYDTSNKIIFECFLAMHEKCKPIDVITLIEELRANDSLKIIDSQQTPLGSNAAFYISKLTNSISSPALIESHCRVLMQKWIMRRLISFSIDTCYDLVQGLDIFSVIEKLKNRIELIDDKIQVKPEEHIKDIHKQVIKHLENGMAEPDKPIGIPTQFQDLDRILNNLQPAKLYVVAARPGMGKTAFTLALAKNIAFQNKAVGFFSLEMNAIELGLRFNSQLNQIELSKIASAKINMQEFEAIHAKTRLIENMNIYIDDTPALSILELRAKARRMVKAKGVECIIIDYMQLMRGSSTKGGNREQEISEISRNLKALSKELNIPVIALSQLSRDVEKRGGEPRPKLSDLRESGSIEQDADTVMFLYRPEYYNISTDNDGNMLPDGLTETIVAKNRSGSLDTAKMIFTGKYVDFTDHNQANTSFHQSKDNEKNWFKID